VAGMNAIDVITLISIMLMMTGIYILGFHYGKISERKRVDALCWNAIQRHYSRSVCWVWNAVVENTKLMDMNKFFGEEK
jgi:hypothetical protein